MIASTKSVIEFEEILNSIHPNIVFIIKLLSKNCLSFRSVEVDNNGFNLVTFNFPQPTHTGLYTKWNSFVPSRFKINLISCLLDRCNRICSYLNKLRLCCLEIIILNTF